MKQMTSEISVDAHAFAAYLQGLPISAMRDELDRLENCDQAFLGQVQVILERPNQESAMSMEKCGVVEGESVPPTEKEAQVETCETGCCKQACGTDTLSKMAEAATPTDATTR